MKKLIILFLLFNFYQKLEGQKARAFQWVMGYGEIGDDTKDGILLDFRNDSLEIAYYPKSMFILDSNAGICSEDGNLLFYSNGCRVSNNNNETLIDGDVLNPGLVEEHYCHDIGCPIPQGAIMLPHPGNPERYFLFNYNLEIIRFNDTTLSINSTLAPTKVFYHELDNLSQSVVRKNQVAVADTMAYGYLQAVQHANGHDWWILAPEAYSNCYYQILLDSTGVHLAGKQCLGQIWNERDWAGQAVFSPDGNKYVRFGPFNGLSIFDFDRCSGQLLSPVFIPFNDISVGGVAISSNSRFLYATTSRKVFQLDLQANNIEESKVLVAEYDGFVDFAPTNFYIAQLAPDNKIYIAGTSGTRFLHVINHPNEQGLACELEQHAIELPVFNGVGLPNFPHFGLGPSESPCAMTVEATEVKADYQISIYPNPVKDRLHVDFKKLRRGKLVLSNVTGQVAMVFHFDQMNNDLDLGNEIVPGMYNCTFYFEEGGRYNERIVVVK